MSPGFKISKVRWHILSYLGTAWAQPGIRYSADFMALYVKKVSALSGMITVDVCLLRDGTISPEQFKLLKDVAAKL
ncbi:MAG: hypothetical protein EOP45_21880 [Sphingobacteriaceae bacterium]|nr:MAG: hypothetical protein EOP45_21880 [Sphingobacteriaceae bacterium]